MTEQFASSCKNLHQELEIEVSFFVPLKVANLLVHSSNILGKLGSVTSNFSNAC